MTGDLTIKERRRCVGVGIVAGGVVGAVVGLAVLPPTPLSLAICAAGAFVGLVAVVVVLACRPRQKRQVVSGVDMGGYCELLPDEAA